MILTRIPTPLSLYRRWKRRQVQQTSALLALPIEILLMVEDFLSDVETAAFRTTCRHLYYHEPLLQSKLVGASRAALLKLFEQDNPKLYYCHSCEILHPLYNISSIQPPDDIWHSCHRHRCHQKRPKRTWRKDDSPCCACDQEEVFVSSKYVLHFDIARLAIDRYFHGDSRGIPLDLLTKRIQPYSSGCFRGTVTETWEARIVDNHLFLSSNRWMDVADVINFNPADGIDFNPGFDWHDYAICQHLWFGFGMKIGTTKIQSLEQYLQLTGGEFKGACEYCLTDYQLDKHSIPKMVKLTTFHCLGTCRSPKDWIWRSSSQRMEYDTVEPMSTIAAPRARKSWVSGALVYEPFTIKKNEIRPCAVLS